MAKINYQKLVSCDYNRYKMIQETEKKLTANYICVKERNNHKGIDFGVTVLTASISDELVLEIERSQTFGKWFKFKIYDKSFIQSPCYRFDSDGAPHYNPTDEPLLERIVYPPHFHMFNENGLEIAYKTDDWVANADILLSDLSSAFQSFAREERISYSTFPSFYKNGELIIPPDNNILDPLQGEDFNE